MTPEETQETRDWWHWCYNDDGDLIEERVLEELYDFRFIISQASKVYSAVTNERMSKLGYYAKDVIAVHEEETAERINAAVRDAVIDALDMIDAGHTREEIEREFPDPYLVP